MGVVVQKFGGTSVATAEKILAAARRAIDAKHAGHSVAVIVSARGHTTDELIVEAKKIHPDPPARELDMLMATGEQVSIALLAMAIDRLGEKAVSLTGGQVGITTDNVHGKARIQGISTKRVRQAFDEGKIAIVAGFQGTDEEQNITTLGRGGSDTTAVALAAALEADTCEIYTDVDGVYTTDPRLVPKARRLEQISYDEMLELASVGAGVMHSRSIEFGKKFGVVIHVRHSAKPITGTLIRPEDPTMMHVVVRGAALSREEARITLRGVPDVPGIVHRIFTPLATAHLVVDMIVQNIAQDGLAQVSFSVPQDDLSKALDVAQEVARRIGAQGVESSVHVAKVSVVGLGMRTHRGVAERMFGALAAHNVNILMISTSEIKISALVARDEAVRALAAAHEEFGLDEPLIELAADPRHPLRPTSSIIAGDDRLTAIARSLPRMEDILVSAVEVADNQGRVSLTGIPDQPGVASLIFATVASAGVAVDLIVQDVGSDGRAHLTFTVLRSDLKTAAEALRGVLARLGSATIVTDDAMTKISVRGVGMRTHTGVAVKMFEALAQANVNIQLISTSELHITVVVDRSQGERAAAALRSTFGV